jgi:VIT1/CCC1 family predicted Fe2+/Mn2+ transporter
LFSGFRVISAPDVHAFERATVDSGDEFRRKRRISCRAFNTHRYLRPRLRNMTTLNRFKYVSHKLIRWFSAIFMVLCLLFTLGAIAALSNVSLAIGVLAIAAVLAVIGRFVRVPIVSGVTEIAMSILATGLGVFEAIGGRNYQTWAPARDR